MNLSIVLLNSVKHRQTEVDCVCPWGNSEPEPCSLLLTRGRSGAHRGPSVFLTLWEAGEQCVLLGRVLLRFIVLHRNFWGLSFSCWMTADFIFIYYWHRPSHSLWSRTKASRGMKETEIDLSWTDLYQVINSSGHEGKGDLWALLLKIEQRTTFSFPFPSPLLFSCAATQSKHGRKWKHSRKETVHRGRSHMPAHGLPAHGHSLYCYKAHFIV